MTGLFTLATGLLRAFDAETAHALAITALKAGLTPSAPAKRSARLQVELFGLNFPNPVGIAAGFDKNAEVPDALLAAGFGFAEAGTVTPLPQAGNPKPRVFRLDGDCAVINRLGFNNDGHAAALQRLEARKDRGGIVGVNIGANKDSEDRVSDYEKGIRTFAHVADYFTVNVSSPNTPGLRGLQSRSELDGLITRLLDALDGTGHQVPVLLKIAPDLEQDELEDIAAVCLQRGVDGIIVSNTTIARPRLRSHKATETGGLSGPPLFKPSTRVLARVYLLTEGKLPLIGVGGVSSGEDAWQKVLAGASLVQLYTGLVFKGLGLVADINDYLDRQLAAEGLSRLSDATGRDAGAWAVEDT